MKPPNNPTEYSDANTLALQRQALSELDAHEDKYIETLDWLKVNGWRALSVQAARSHWLIKVCRAPLAAGEGTMP